jgi:hypothetical protein
VDDNIDKDEALDCQIKRLFVVWDRQFDDYDNFQRFVQELNQLRAVWAGWRGEQLQLEFGP